MPSPAGTATLTGRAFVAIEGRQMPVRRAEVVLQDADSDAVVALTDTDTDGGYVFRSVAGGEYRVVVDKPGFVPFERGPGRAFEPPPVIAIADGQAAIWDVQMQRGAALEGRLLDERGRPVENIVVSAMRRAFGADGATLIPAATARTDDLGRYRIHTLRTGEYLIEAAPDPRALLTQRVAPAPRPPGPARTYYPGTPRAAEARSVPLRAGGDAVGLDFTVTSVPLAVVRGRVILASGAPATPATFSVRMRPIDAPVAAVAGTIVGTNEFYFPNVVAGEYRLMVVATGGPASPLEFASSRLSVEGRDLGDITVVTATGRTLSGRVEVADGSDPLPSGLQVVAIEAELAWPTPRAVPPTALRDAVSGDVTPDGAFTLPNVAGARRIGVERLPAGWALSHVAVGSENFTDRAVDVGAATGPIRVVVTSRTATVTGRVVDDTGQPFGRARVVLFAADNTRWEPGSRFVHTVETGRDGGFEFSGVLPGSWRLSAMAYMDPGSWLDPAVLGALWSSSVPAGLAAGQTLSMSFTVAR